MKQRLYSLFCLLFFVSILQAQVSKYSFTQKNLSSSTNDYYCPNSFFSSNVYSDVTSKTLDSTAISKHLFLNNVSDTISQLSGKGYSIDFDFIYDGKKVDRVGISTNCYIKLGNSNDGDLTMYNDTTAGNIFVSGKNEQRSNVISAFQINADLFKYANIMTVLAKNMSYYPGQRYFVVNITKESFILYPILNIKTQSVSSTFFLREWKNEIELINDMPFPFEINSEAYVGLRGKAYNNEMTNLNIRKVTSGVNTWLTSIAGDSINSHCDFSSTLMPSSKLVYSFIPPAPDTIKSPEAFFECNSWDSIPNFISLYGSGLSNSGYVLAKGATEIPTNSILYWSPEYTSSTNYYKIYLGTDSLDMTMLSDSLTSTQYDLSTLAAGTTYYYKIIAYNATGVANPTVGWFTTVDALSYCNTPYAYNALRQTVTLNTLKYTYQATTTSDGTWDHRRKLPEEAPYITTLQRDSSYLFSVTYIGNSTLYYTHCWIDFNHDGVFNTTTEQFNESSNIKVPSDAILGKTIMRVGTKANSTTDSFIPCSGNMFYQDYTVTIEANDSCKTLTISPVLTSPTCYGSDNGSINLNSSGGTTPYAIKWEKGGTTLSATTSSISNLGIGTYQAFVTDKKACSVQTDLLALTQPYPVSIDTSTVSDSLLVTVRGGTTPYTYRWLDSTNKVVATTLVVPDSTGIYTLIVTDSNSCDSTFKNIKVTKKASGINLISADNDALRIYPNPTKGEIQILSTSTITKLDVTDITGKAIYTKNKLNSTKVKLNINTLPVGVYLVKAYTNNGQETGEVVKQ